MLLRSRQGADPRNLLGPFGTRDQTRRASSECTASAQRASGG